MSAAQLLPRIPPATEPPGWLWDGTGPICPCQFGRCANCAPERARHRQCLSVETPLVETPAAWLTPDRGDGPSIPVYELGHRHHWICPCHKAGHVRATAGRGCYCRIGGWFDGWHLRGAPDCVASAETQLDGTAQLFLFSLEGR